MFSRLKTLDYWGRLPWRWKLKYWQKEYFNKTGWWFQPLWKIFSQWEGLSHILWKIKIVPKHQPENVRFFLFSFQFSTASPWSRKRTLNVRPPAPSIRLWNKEIDRIEGSALLQQAVLVYGVNQWRSSWELKNPVFHWIWRDLMGFNGI